MAKTRSVTQPGTPQTLMAVGIQFKSIRRKRPISSQFRREKSVKLKKHLSHDLDGGGETRGLCRPA